MAPGLPTRVVIASRKSLLAMWQAEHVRSALQRLHPGLDVVIDGMTTQGDRVLDRSLSKIGGKGLFVKELEAALLEGRADLAVHSLKDVPMSLEAGLRLAAVLEREDPRDAFVSTRHASPDALPPGAVVGTSSLRRESAVHAAFPQVVVKPLRGNIDTRLAKLDRGEYDAILLASAGLIRLGLASRIRMPLDAARYVPSPGQGAMAIETRADRPDLVALLAPLDHAPTSIAVHAERAVSRALGGNCTMPLGAHATWRGADRMTLTATLARPDGTTTLGASAERAIDADRVASAEALGRDVAADLISQGGLALVEASSGKRLFTPRQE